MPATTTIQLFMSHTTTSIIISYDKNYDESTTNCDA
jgi:hypothetical protein